MNREELTKVRDFYDNVISQQIIKPQDINEIFLLVQPDGNVMQPYFKKMRAISVYVQGLQAQVLNDLEDLFEATIEIPDTDNPMSPNYIDKTDTVIPEGNEAVSQDNGEQSHSEGGMTQEGEITIGEGDVVLNELTPQQKIDALREQYKEADANLKRSITQRIKHLTKELENGSI